MKRDWRKRWRDCVRSAAAGCFAVTGKSTGAEIYPLYGHSRIYLLQMKDVAFVSSRMAVSTLPATKGKRALPN